MPAFFRNTVSIEWSPPTIQWRLWCCATSFRWYLLFGMVCDDHSFSSWSNTPSLVFFLNQIQHTTVSFFLIPPVSCRFLIFPFLPLLTTFSDSTFVRGVPFSNGGTCNSRGGDGGASSPPPPPPPLGGGYFNQHRACLSQRGRKVSGINSRKLCGLKSGSGAYAAYRRGR